MKLNELKEHIQQYQYFEDMGIIDIACASIIATRMQLGDPVWMIIIGASSGGKSQILRPLALTDSKFIHRIDDLTENTFLSGMKVAKGKPEPSLLHRIGTRGIIVISDLTVIFSKNKETRNTILSQFRMIYDGEMTKFSGTSGEPLHWGPGSLGILAGSTPSIYHHFEEVSDMGERFIYYRMKDYDALKATRLAMNRHIFGKKLDEDLSDRYAEYIKETILSWGKKEIILDEEVRERIMQVAFFSERIRTSIHMDFQRKEVVRKPVPAFPMRVALQLIAVAKGLTVMAGETGLTESDMHNIEWVGWSLANEEKRGVLTILAKTSFNIAVSTQKIADELGLSTNVTNTILQNLSAVGVLQRTGGLGGSLAWFIKSESDHKLVRRILNLGDKTIVYDERGITSDEEDETRRANEEFFNSIPDKQE